MVVSEISIQKLGIAVHEAEFTHLLKASPVAEDQLSSRASSNISLNIETMHNPLASAETLDALYQGGENV